MWDLEKKLEANLKNVSDTVQWHLSQWSENLKNILHAVNDGVMQLQTLNIHLGILNDVIGGATVAEQRRSASAPIADSLAQFVVKFSEVMAETVQSESLVALRRENAHLHAEMSRLKRLAGEPTEPEEDDALTAALKRIQDMEIWMKDQHRRLSHVEMITEQPELPEGRV